MIRSILVRHGGSRGSATSVAALAILLIFAAPTVHACGPFLDPSILQTPDAELLKMPESTFAAEINRIPLPNVPFKYNEKEPIETVADLTAALKARGDTKADADKLIAQANFLITNCEKESDKNKIKAAKVTISPTLPPEFFDYLTGWYQYKAGFTAEADEAWNHLLARPAKDRQWLSVAALYMLGRCEQQRDQTDYNAVENDYREARQLAGQGFHDSQALAAASYGWEARAELDQGHFDRAIDLYLQQLATGDKRAIQSLQLTAIEAFKSGEAVLRTLAGKPTARAVLTAYIVSQGGPWQPRPKAETAVAWLSAVETANVPHLDGAERMAWSAYQYGQFNLAERWLKRADPKQPISLWLNGKFALRSGKVDQAIQFIAAASTAFPQDDPSGVYLPFLENGWNVGRFNNFPLSQEVDAELAILHLSRSEYVDSLDLLLKGGWWVDAAYVGERVLTADELKAYVDKHITAPPPTTQPTQDQQMSLRIRNLLARRLVRLGRWKDARPYFTPDMQKTLDQYINAIRAGHDAKRSKADRADAFWIAAKIARTNGMELMGTELDPDDAIYDGNYPNIGPTPDGNKPSPFRGPTADEIKRLHRPPEQIDKRFHYRYLAADHAWAAAELMPDNSDELARRLNEAGTWLKNRDPLAAERFYQAMITRCPDTSLGDQAKTLKWFVPIEDKK